MQNIFKLNSAIILIASLCLSGCGYTQKTVLPAGIKTVYVETVKNAIPVQEVYAYQPGLEIDITDAVVRRFHRDGNLKVVERAKADAILEAYLVGFNQEGVRFNQLERVEEFRMFAVLDMRLIDRKTNNVIWEEKNFSGDAEYFVSEIRSLAREEASRRAIDRLAKNVVDRTVEDW